MKLSRSFKFEAAHRLPGYKGKCSRLHGHTWTLEVEFEGKVDPTTGFVADFSELKRFVNRRVVSKLDHQYLNTLGYSFSDNPTCEHIIVWIWNRLLHRTSLQAFVPPHLLRIRLYESTDSYAEYDGEGL